MLTSKIINKIILIFILTLTISCVSRIENRGYSFNLSDYNIKKGISSKQAIYKNMGSPTLTSYIDGEEFWIYMEEEIEKFLFFKPKVLDRKIVSITFNKNNLVKTVNKYNLENENKIAFSQDKTKLKQDEKGFFADIFGNVGQVRAY